MASGTLILDVICCQGRRPRLRGKRVRPNGTVRNGSPADRIDLADPAGRTGHPD